MNASVNDSYLITTEDNGVYDDELDFRLNEWICNITGISVELIRPLWQTDAPKIPAKEINWIAFGVTHFDNDNPYFNQLDDKSITKNDEELTVLVRFYGNDAQRIANNFLLSIQVPQNNYQLNKLGLTFHRASNVGAFPELFNNQWFRRFDLTLYLRRRNERDHQIKTIQSFDLNFIVEK